jgi:methyltransferase (TIGR00027 family)
MREGIPSGTARRVALRRAAHQVFDDPVVFRDPLALKILGLDADSLALSDLRAPSRPHSIAMRAFLVARACFAEETLARAVHTRRVEQYVLLGAGLDTFAYRNPYADLRVFEVDHPDTQAWKLHVLDQNQIPVPDSVRHVAVDFHHDSLGDELLRAGFDAERPAVFAWLGVVPYLSEEGFSSTLSYLAGCANGSELIFDYGLPRHALPLLEQLAFDSLQARVTASGEPFQLFFEPDEIRDALKRKNWHVLEDLGRDAMNARYFTDRRDQLRCLGSGGHLVSAELRRP